MQSGVRGGMISVDASEVVEDRRERSVIDVVVDADGEVLVEDRQLLILILIQILI